MTTYIYTSICLNYVPKARVLAQSVKKQHPDVKFVVVLAESTKEDLLSYEPAFDEVIQIHELGIPQLDRWMFKHELVEACTAIKGFALTNLLRRPDCDRVLYFDPDIVVFDKLYPIYDALLQSQIVLTPHITEPARSIAGIKDHEKATLKYGTYNLGFLAVANRRKGRRFAGWWQDRLYQYCYNDIPEGLFTDQRWVDLVPALFRSTGILRHPGCNVATWNLENRQVRGDIDTGFTVEGQKLIFYHFSGFDSGAHLEQLAVYAAGMRAPHLLREWYIDRCNANDERNYAALPWAYGLFDNGKPVTKLHRQLYRSRRDLQKAFPNPYQTGDTAKSFYHWFEAEMGPSSDSVEMSPASDRDEKTGRKVTLLERYLTDKTLFHLSPHPAFNGHASVAAAEDDSNPLLQMVLKGMNGASSHLPEPRREEKALLTPIDRLSAKLTADLPRILCIGHWGGGGTEIHMELLARLLKGRANFLLLHPLDETTVTIRELEADRLKGIRFNIANGIDDLADAVRQLGIHRIHVHHLLGNETYLRELLTQLQIPFDLTLHDYYLFCPSPQLSDEQGRYVGEDFDMMDRHCKVALKQAGMSSSREWMARHRWLINEASRVFAPSTDAAERAMRLSERADIMALPHPEPRRPEIAPVVIPPLKTDATMKILLLGHLSPHKGAAIVEACAQLAKDKKLPLEFHVAGSMPKMATFPATNLWHHGEYRADDVLHKIRAIGPHLAWFPILWPETYCYALSEAMHAGLPVAATDLGALNERLVNRPWTWQVSWQTDAAAWINRLLAIRDELIAHPDDRRTGSTRITDGTAFYHTSYLQPALETMINAQMQSPAGPSQIQHHAA